MPTKGLNIAPDANILRKNVVIFITMYIFACTDIYIGSLV